MKHFLGIILSLTLLCGCGISFDNNAVDTTESLKSYTETTVADNESEIKTNNTVNENNNVLIAYFSQSGNTEKLAQIINNNICGDIIKIETLVPYKDDYNALLDQAKSELEEDARPELSTHIENMDSYDVIFIGYPNWWSDLPRPILSFVDEYDFDGKVIIPFCTSGGGGFGKSIESLKSALQDAVFYNGLHINGSNVNSAENDVKEWLEKLNLGM